jgi:arsenite methyltransferase
MKTIILLAALCVTLACPALAEDQHQHRRPHDIKQYLEHLDRSERDQYQKPSEVIEALDLQPGMAVADLGSGSGYFTRRFVKAVTDTGIVYAIDVEPEMLTYVKESLLRLGLPHRVEFVIAKPDQVPLPPASVDLIFVCNTLHHLDNRAQYFRTVSSALKPGGRIAIIDFYPDERSGELGFPKRHLVSRDTAVTEMTAAGYRLTQEHTFLPKQYFLEFTPAR